MILGWVCYVIAKHSRICVQSGVHVESRYSAIGLVDSTDDFLVLLPSTWSISILKCPTVHCALHIVHVTGSSAAMIWSGLYAWNHLPIPASHCMTSARSVGHWDIEWALVRHNLLVPPEGSIVLLLFLNMFKCFSIRHDVFKITVARGFYLEFEPIYIVSIKGHLVVRGGRWTISGFPE